VSAVEPLQVGVAYLVKPSGKKGTLIGDPSPGGPSDRKVRLRGHRGEEWETRAYNLTCTWDEHRRRNIKRGGIKDKAKALEQRLTATYGLRSWNIEHTVKDAEKVVVKITLDEGQLDQLLMDLIVASDSR